MHVIAAKAVALKEALTPEFKLYQQQIVRNAKALAAALMQKGFKLISGGTDNHLILIDLTNKAVTGKSVAKALDRARITTNYNTVPFDPRKPFDPSGIRIGTPAVTTRGMREAEMERIAGWIDQVVEAVRDQRGSAIAAIADDVRELALGFPVPGAVD